MTNYRVTARRDYIITFQGEDTQNYVALADALSLEYFGQELDSPDAGDATDLYVRLFTEEKREQVQFEGRGCHVIVTSEDHLYKWDHS